MPMNIQNSSFLLKGKYPNGMIPLIRYAVFEIETNVVEKCIEKPPDRKVTRANYY